MSEKSTSSGEKFIAGSDEYLQLDPEGPPQFEQKLESHKQSFESDVPRKGASLNTDNDLSYDDEEYEAWLESEPVVDRLPPEFKLNEESLTRKQDLQRQLDELHRRLISPEVQEKAYYGSGGQNEVIVRMQALQREKLPEVYADIRYESGFLPIHTMQRSEKWCQLASMENALRTFDPQSLITQEDIAQELQVAHHSGPETSRLMDWARRRGFRVDEVSTVLDMISTLTTGGKVMLSMGQHATGYGVGHTILISGIQIDRGKIVFIDNDSGLLGNTPGTIGLNRMIELIQPTGTSNNRLTPSYALSLPSATPEAWRS